MSIKATPTEQLPPLPWRLPEPVVIEHEGEAAWAMWDSAWAELDEKEQQ